MKPSKSFTEEQTKPKLIMDNKKVINMLAVMESFNLDYSKMENLIMAYSVASCTDTIYCDLSVKLPNRIKILNDLNLIEMKNHSGETEFSQYKNVSETTQSIVEELLKKDSIDWDCLDYLAASTIDNHNYDFLRMDILSHNCKKFVDARMFLENLLESYLHYYDEVVYLGSLEPIRKFVIANETLPTVHRSSDPDLKLNYLYLASMAINIVSSLPGQYISLDDYKKVFINVLKTLN